MTGGTPEPGLKPYAESANSVEICSDSAKVCTTSPMKNGNRQGDYRNAPRCGAKTRQGTPCKGPGMRNGRCRMHGGCSTGPKTPEGIERIRAAQLKHGYFTAEAKLDFDTFKWPLSIV